jgi:hypothetical protein
MFVVWLQQLGILVMAEQSLELDIVISMNSAKELQKIVWFWNINNPNQILKQGVSSVHWPGEAGLQLRALK